MYCIVYMSVANKLDPDGICDIWTGAQASNEKSDISGLLLYSRGIFMQCLEGEEKTVKTLYNKIARDARHVAVATLFEGPIKERTFGEWSMGYHWLSEAERCTLAKELKWDWAVEKLNELEGMSNPASLLKRMLHVYFNSRSRTTPPTLASLTRRSS